MAAKKSGGNTATIEAPEAPKRARAKAGAKAGGGQTTREMAANLTPAKAKTKAAAMPAGATVKAGAARRHGATKKVVAPKPANARGR